MKVSMPVLLIAMLLAALPVAADVVVLWDETSFAGSVTSVDAVSVLLTQKGREIRFQRDEIASIIFTASAPAALGAGSDLPDEDTGVQTLFGNTGRHRGWLVGRFYNISRSQDVLPDFSTLSPHSVRLYTPVLNVPKQRAYSHGPIGYRSTDFAISYEGDFTVATADNYTIDLASDDGSRLYIDGVLCIDNDGSHGLLAKRTQVAITRGTHRLRVDYFQDSSEVALGLRIAGSGQALRLWDVTKPLGQN